MLETLSVSLSGPAFSFLLYENVKGPYGQEGFLLGEIIERETRIITDNDQTQVRKARVIKVNSCVPCPKLCYFYDHIGRVDTKKIENYLGELTPKVVAWYKYRPASSFSLTFREKIVHKQLASFFKISADFFTCCLLINEASQNCSTHSYSQSFLRLNGHSLEQLPLHIVNLSDPNNSYRTPEPPSATFSSILNGLRINHMESQGLNIITKISSALQKHTDIIAQNLSEAEDILFHLENEVKKSQESLKAKQLSSASNNSKIHLNDLNEKTICNNDVKLANNTNNDNSKKGRSKAKSGGKGEKRVSQSPAKRSSIERENDINLRLRKRN